MCHSGAVANLRALGDSILMCAMTGAYEQANPTKDRLTLGAALDAVAK
jgi:hypothetical protein